MSALTNAMKGHMKRMDKIEARERKLRGQYMRALQDIRDTATKIVWPPVGGHGEPIELATRLTLLKRQLVIAGALRNKIEAL